MPIYASLNASYCVAISKQPPPSWKQNCIVGSQLAIFFSFNFPFWPSKIGPKAARRPSGNGEPTNQPTLRRPTRYLQTDFRHKHAHCTLLAVHTDAKSRKEQSCFRLIMRYLYCALQGACSRLCELYGTCQLNIRRATLSAKFNVRQEQNNSARE